MNRLAAIKVSILEGITLIAVSKGQSIKSIEAIIAEGQKHFGENYVQEALEKIKALKNADLIWHYLGKIQSNKLKEIVAYFDYVHSVDSLKHAEALSRECQKQQKTMSIFLQVNFENEPSKNGFSPDALSIALPKIKALPNLNLIGLMLIPSPKENHEQQQTFAAFRAYRDIVAQKCNITLPELSMGMSADYLEAIKEGATYIRIGTKIFGARSL